MSNGGDRHTPYPVDEEFAAAINARFVGKTIASAKALDDVAPVHGVEIAFTDGTSLVIHSEYDEGFVVAT